MDLGPVANESLADYGSSSYWDEKYAVLLASLHKVSKKNSTEENDTKGEDNTNMESDIRTFDWYQGYEELEPHISKQTLEFHHDKHHAKYVATCNEMTQGTDLENASVEDIIMASKGNNQGLFNNAAQSYNHAFYWQCLKAGGGGAPTGKVADMINESFGSYDAFRKEMVTAAATAFGSGWAWLVQEKGSNKLSVHKTIGADTPLADGHTPLLTIDVWEHAYYLDYQNLRPTYIDTVMDNLVNWDFVNSNIRS